MADPHGGVHLWMGGYLDCDLMYNKIGHLVGADIANEFAYLANAHRKGLFCEETWICNRTASDDETPYEVSAEDLLSLNTFCFPSSNVQRTLLR